MYSITLNGVKCSTAPLGRYLYGVWFASWLHLPSTPDVNAVVESIETFLGHRQQTEEDFLQLAAAPNCLRRMLSFPKKRED